MPAYGRRAASGVELARPGAARVEVPAPAIVYARAVNRKLEARDEALGRVDELDGAVRA